jgi:hypothetical protein
MSGEHYGDRLSSLSGGLNKNRRVRENNIDICTDQIGGEFRQLINAFRPPKLNHNVIALYIAEVTQATPQGLHTFRPSGRIAKSQEADPRDLCHLLRAHSERPRSSAADKRDERTPFHCRGSPVLPAKRIAHVSYGQETGLATITLRRCVAGSGRTLSQFPLEKDRNSAALSGNDSNHLPSVLAQ